MKQHLTTNDLLQNLFLVIIQVRVMWDMAFELKYIF